MICFESYQGIPYSHKLREQKKKDGEHIANG